jgi:hypothetical protein
MVGARKWRFRLVGFLVRICRRWEQFRLNEPDEVRLNRLAAPRLVLIFGIASTPQFVAFATDN